MLYVINSPKNNDQLQGGWSLSNMTPPTSVITFFIDHFSPPHGPFYAQFLSHSMLFSVAVREESYLKVITLLATDHCFWWVITYNICGLPQGRNTPKYSKYILWNDVWQDMSVHVIFPLSCSRLPFFVPRTMVSIQFCPQTPLFTSGSTLECKTFRQCMSGYPSDRHAYNLKFHTLPIK